MYGFWLEATWTFGVLARQGAQIAGPGFFLAIKGTTWNSALEHSTSALWVPCTLPFGIGFGTLMITVMRGYFLYDGSCTESGESVKQSRTKCPGTARVRPAHTKRATLTEIGNHQIEAFSNPPTASPSSTACLVSSSGSPQPVWACIAMPYLFIHLGSQSASRLFPHAIGPLLSCQSIRAELQSRFRTSSIGPPCPTSFDCKAGLGRCFSLPDSNRNSHLTNTNAESIGCGHCSTCLS
jgi:hypothetical protein